MEKKKIYTYLIFCIISSIVFVIPQSLWAASLYISPATGSYAVGKTFSVSVTVSSPDQAINGTSGVITFPSNLLEVTSVSKSGSIITLWVQEPSFSNQTGRINFEGIILNPGFTGNNGRVLTVQFKVKAAGPATLGITSGSVLANDGEGTNVLKSLGRGQLTLTDSSITPAPEPKSNKSVGVPSKPLISSSTHPDPSVWYAKKDAQFSWSISPGINGVRLLVDKNPNSVPTITAPTVITERAITDIDDGVWYMHTQLRNTQGWGEVDHFAFQIDTTPPEPFTITFPEGNISHQAGIRAIITATDATSGVDYYEIKIDNGDFIHTSTADISSETFRFPPQEPGKHTVIVKAVDKAGNEMSSVSEFEIIAIPKPIISEYTQSLTDKEVLKIKGQGQPDSVVIFNIVGKNGQIETHETHINKDGFFEVTWPHRLKVGQYYLSARIIDSSGGYSVYTTPVKVVVKSSQFLGLGIYPVATIILTVLCLMCMFLLWRAWRRIKLLEQRLSKDKKPIVISRKILTKKKKLL